jgi:cysteine-rich repeat protein
MRAPRALLTLLTTLTLSACNGSNDGSSVSAAGQTSEAATTEATGTGFATTPTTTVEPASTTGPGEGSSGAQSGTTTTGPEMTGSTGSTGGVDTVDTGSETGTTSTTSTTSTTGGDTSTGAGSETGSSTGPGCPEGQDGCPCGNGCDPGLACMLGVCGPAPKCGDGKVDPGEGCDDGANNGDSKACTSKCTKQVCGDGYLGANEACDDGNQNNGDGCEKTCVKTPVMPAKDACGFDSDGVWFQIDYSNANTVSSPSYTYSPTPGWGEAQWAPAGKSWPYAVDLFNNASVITDQIGKVALLNGTNKAVRVYFGLVGLSYSYATVCVEGRSYSVGSSVTFLVQEAKTKCGNSGNMANDWVIHATGVDLDECFLADDDFQAVQVQPSGGSGSLSLKRLRVTLHNAVY